MQSLVVVAQGPLRSSYSREDLITQTSSFLVIKYIIQNRDQQVHKHIELKEISSLFSITPLSHAGKMLLIN